MRAIHHCAFCGRSGSEVNWLVAGPCAFICDICVCQAVGIVAEKYPAFRGQVIAELDAATQKSITRACRVHTNQPRQDAAERE